MTSEMVDVLDGLTMKKISAKPFDTMEDAILFAISLPQAGRFICIRPNFKRVVIRNGSVERVIQPFSGRHSKIPPRITT